MNNVFWDKYAYQQVNIIKLQWLLTEKCQLFKFNKGKE